MTRSKLLEIILFFKPMSICKSIGGIPDKKHVQSSLVRANIVFSTSLG